MGKPREINGIIHLLINKLSGTKGGVRKGVLKNFAKLTVKHLRQSLFFNKVAGLRP